MPEFRLDRHNKNQLELKLTYRLKSQTGRQSYRVETYMFIPLVLGIKPTTYGPAEFYGDTVSFIRLTAPTVHLQDLSSKRAVKPWSSQVKSKVGRFVDSTEEDTENAEQDLKLLACIYKDALKHSHLNSRQAISKAKAEHDYATIASVLNEFTDDCEAALKRLHKIGSRSQKPSVPVNIQECWKAISEYTSLITEEALTDLVVLLSDNNDEPTLRQPLKRTKELAISQYRDRREQGCSTYAAEGHRNEYLPRRWRVLKRYISSALYLTVAREQVDGLASNVVGMFAAACAMIFATTALILINETWTADLSIAFLAAMTASYVVKDRIKETGKRKLGSRLRKWLPDHKVKIVGLHGNRIGTATETVTIRNPATVPEDIIRKRSTDLNSHEAIGGRPETILHYDKTIELSSSKLRKQFSGATGLVDVIRLNISPMIGRMTDAWEHYQYIHPETQEIQTTRCARVYHFNIVMRLSDHDGHSELHRVRVVANKKGIVRVEDVEVESLDEQLIDKEPTEPTKMVFFDD